MTRARDVADTQDNVGGSVAPFVGAKNRLLNADFSIWQRGTSISTGYSYTADRWFAYRAGAYPGLTASRQSSGLTGFRYCARVQRDSGNATNYYLRLQQVLETSASISLAGQNVTLSFYARRGVNYSQASNLLTVNIYSGTGTDENGVDGFATGNAVAAGSTVSLTTSWQRFTLTGAVASNATQVAIYVAYDPTGTAGANDYFEITGVQLEAASVATPFTTATGNPASELAACQRYYQKFLGAGSGQVISGFGGCVTTTIAQASIVFPVQMRTGANSFDGYLPAWYNYANNTTYNSGTFTMTDVTPSIVKIRYTHGSSIFTAGQGGEFVTSGGNGYLAFSAEL